jgi:hypothetical protein
MMAEQSSPGCVVQVQQLTAAVERPVDQRATSQGSQANCSQPRSDAGDVTGVMV